MKKYAFFYGVAAIIGLLSFIGCKKEIKTVPVAASSPLSPQPDIKSMARYTKNFSVDSYGFLVFASATAVDDYITFIENNTHSYVQSYLDTAAVGFASLGQSKYGSSYASSVVTEAQAVDYLLGAGRMFEVRGIIIRPTDSTSCTSVPWQYILTMTRSRLTSTTYATLAGGTYDSTSMDKFATNPSSPVDLFATIRDTPTGYRDNVATSCPTTNPEARFWGWAAPSCTQSGQYMDGNGDYHPAYSVCKKHYIFWINDQTDCYVAYSCGD